MCSAIVRSNISVDWSARGTVEVREQVMADLAAAGCRRLHVGIESLDDDILLYLKKSCRFKHIKEFCRLANKYGITVLAYFIIGVPGESEEYRKTLPERIQELGIRLPYVNVLTPLAETPYYNDLVRSGQFKTDHWAEFCENPTKDFVIPTVRTDDEEMSLRRTVDDYVGYFKRFDMPIFVS